MNNGKFMDIAKEENDAPSERERCILFCRGATEEDIARQAADLHEYAKAHNLVVIECIPHVGGMAVDLSGDRIIELLIGRKPGGARIDALLTTDWSRLTRRRRVLH